MGHLIGGGFLKATTKEAAMREGYHDIGLNTRFIFKYIAQKTIYK